MAPMMDYRESSPAQEIQSRSLDLVQGSASIEDVEGLVMTELSAFAEELTNHLLSFRDNRNPAHQERLLRLYRAKLGQQNADSHFPVSEFPKVTDRRSEAITSFAHFERKQHTIQEWHTPCDSSHQDLPPVNRDWFAMNDRWRLNYMGTRRHIYLAMLATQPCFQHQGAGTMLLNSILQKADEEHVQIYLEATKKAKPMYAKHGFKPLIELCLDPADYGYTGFDVERQTIMVRGALNADGVRQEPLDWDMGVELVQLEMERTRPNPLSGRL